MTTTSAADSTTTATPTGGAVVWAYDPWAERPRTATLAALCAAGMCALVVAAHLPFLMGIGIGLFCVASVAPALTRVECRVDARGASRRGLLGWERRRWEDVRRVQDLPAGVLLSAHARRHWLDATRAMMLPMPASQREVLRASIAGLRTAHGR